MSTINTRKLEKLLDEIPDLDPETRKKIEEANKPRRSSVWGWGMEPLPLKQSKLILSKD